MKLSDRLQVIADQINEGETMADIGTDHGFLPLYLWENKICSKAIMADIGKGPLQKAMDNCRLYYPKELENGTFDLRLGNGIRVLEPNEVDVLCIAGMGGILMTDILGDDIEKSHSFKKIILQPRNHIGKLRQWLLNNGFEIKSETLVKEGRNICEILTVIPSEKITAIANKLEYIFPFSLIENSNSLTREYLERHLNKEKKIIERIEKNSKKDNGKILLTKERISWLENLLNKIGE